MLYKPFTTNYTWEIIDDIKEYLEVTNKDQTTLDTLDLCHLLGEIERLSNIITELEKWLKDEKEATIFDYHNAIEDVIDKLIELKGDENNE